MKIAVVNRLGFFMALAAFGLAYTLRLQWSWLSDGVVLAVAAGMCFVLDIFWRVGKGKRKWFRTGSGGTIFYMPLWLLGLAWLALCAYQTYVKPIPALANVADRMTWTTSAPVQAQTQSQSAMAKSQ
jgi:hypothetical protein